MPPHVPSAGRNRPKGQSIKSIRRLVTYLKPYKFGVAGALASLLFTSTAVLGIGMGLRHLIDEGIVAENPQLLDQGFQVLIGVVILLAFASFTRSFLVTWVGENVVADLRRDVYAHVVRLDPYFFETTPTGELLSRITTDTTLIQNVVGSSLSMALRNVLLIVGGGVLLLITSLKLTGYVFLILPLVIVPIIVLSKRVRRLSRMSQDRVADISAHAGETLNAVSTIQAFSLEELETAKFQKKVKSALGTAMRRTWVRSTMTAIVIALIFGAVALVLWMGGRDVVAGNITPGDLSSFLFYAVVVAGAIGGVSDIVGELQRAAGAVERLFELLEVESRVSVESHPLKLREPVSGRVTFEHVTFAYPSQPDRPSLRDFSLDIRPGETVALVGPSGSGKTTFLQLLLRFYDPQEGHIVFDGLDITHLNPAEMRQYMGMVPQDTVIFSATAEENIRYGRPQATAREVLEAAEAAGATEFLMKLPKGMDTWLGERGVRLSGGQRQRIAIARAILRNPRVLLLDEATSALDSENEKVVQEALERLMKDRTTIVIAHRLATVLKASRIVVLNEGRIESIGSHQKLIRQSPLYKRLADLQFGSGDSAVYKSHASPVEPVPAPSSKTEVEPS